MLETALIALGTALAVSLAVGFLRDWALRIRLRRCELGIEEALETVYVEKKKRAAAVSVASRQTQAAAFDAATVKAHTGVDLGEEAPWWSGVVGKRTENGPPQ